MQYAMRSMSSVDHFPSSEDCGRYVFCSRPSSYVRIPLTRPSFGRLLVGHAAETCRLVLCCMNLLSYCHHICGPLPCKHALGDIDHFAARYLVPCSADLRFTRKYTPRMFPKKLLSAWGRRCAEEVKSYVEGEIGSSLYPLTDRHVSKPCGSGWSWIDLRLVCCGPFDLSMTARTRASATGSSSVGSGVYAERLGILIDIIGLTWGSTMNMYRFGSPRDVLTLTCSCS